MVRIVFLGTPDFAVPSLRALLEEGFDVAAVVTRPDRPKGRSRSKRVPSPVKTAALEEGLPVLQPERPNTRPFIDQFRDLGPDLGVIVAYGHILKPALLEIPTHGLINVHASLLPRLRGAAPIEQAILNGDEETGVSIMQLEPDLDSGPIIHQLATPVAPDETGGELTARLAELGALALVEALLMIASGASQPNPQDHTLATYAPKLTREGARIGWDQPADLVARQVRALDPRPGAWTAVSGRELKMYGPQPADGGGQDDRPGDILETDPALVVATATEALQFLDVQPAGRQRMAATAWCRGKGASKGDRFE